MQTELIKGEILKKVANASETAGIITLELALRKRLRHFSDINRLKTELIRAGKKIVDRDYNQFWKDLEKTGVGSIIYSRSGKAPRFEWFYSLKKVTTAAIDGVDIEGYKKDKTKSPNVKIRKNPVNTIKFEEPAQIPTHVVKEVFSRATTSSNKKLIFIPLRPDFNLEFQLPENLTEQEVQFIQNTISKAAQ